MNPLVPSAQPAHLGWRLLAIVYDLFPVLASWFLIIFAIELTHEVPLSKTPHPDIQPHLFTAYAEYLLLWLMTGAYAVISWRRGGQTIGMRPWRLKVVGADGRLASWGALCLRFAVATVSTIFFGLGLLWCLIERERRSWHDIAAGTRLVRLDRLPSDRSPLNRPDSPSETSPGPEA